MRVKRERFEKWLVEERKIYMRMWMEYCLESGDAVTFYDFLRGLEFREGGEEKCH